MHFTQLIAFVASATMAVAAPAAAPDAKRDSIHVKRDHVVLTGEGGRYQIMKRSEFEKHFADELAASRRPAHLEPGFITYTGEELANATRSHVSKRDEITVIIPGEKQRFVGWDYQVSEIVQGGLETKVYVAEGYQVSNSVAVEVGAELTIVENFLKTSMSITETWTTTNSLTTTFYTDVPEGKWGAWVFQAMTNRQYGSTWTGNLGSQGSVSTWMADSLEPKSYGVMSWVNGYFSPCIQDSFPMKRCHGEGEL